MGYRNKADLYRYQVARWTRIKIRAIAHKGGSCTVCHGTFLRPAMQFHQRDPKQKEVNWVKLRLRAWARIVEELDKCDLVCANCHAIIHSKEWPAHQESNPEPTP
jgi:predicted HNH restriction endonuclease